MKTVIEMAREAGILATFNTLHPSIEIFAALVRADERNSWPAEMEAMERQVNILTDALAEERNKWMERTAILIRGEREACAKVCEEVGEESDSFTRDILRSTAAAIRARSNT